MSVEDVYMDKIPDIDNVKDKKEINPLLIYFMKVGDALVKCSYSNNGRTMEESFLVAYV